MTTENPEHLTVPPFVGPQHDLVVEGMEGANVLYVSAGGNQDWTGLVPARGGQLLLVHNADDTDTIVLYRESVVSAAANRFRIGTATHPLLPGGSLWLFYSAELTRWLTVSPVVIEDFMTNTSGIFLPLAARSTSQESADIDNPYGRGIRVSVNVTDIAGGGSITPSVQTKDANGVYKTVATGAALIAVGATALVIYPGITAVAGFVFNDVVSGVVKIVITANNALPLDYSVAYDLIV